MRAIFRFLQIGVGLIVLVFFGTLFFDGGISALHEALALILIGVAIWAALWLVHRLVVGTTNGDST